MRKFLLFLINDNNYHFFMKEFFEKGIIYLILPLNTFCVDIMLVIFLVWFAALKGEGNTEVEVLLC